MGAIDKEGETLLNVDAPEERATILAVGPWSSGGNVCIRQAAIQASQISNPINSDAEMMPRTMTPGSMSSAC